MVRQGRFRSDLYHRLSVVPVRIAPLRQRPQDLEPLVRHFMEKHRGLLNAPCELGPDFAEALRHLPLPGNARELENLVRQALLAKRHSGPLGLRDLPYEIWQEICLRACAGGEAPGVPASRSASPLTGLEHILDSHRWRLADSLSHCEREMIDAALLRTNGNRTKAAQLLGITPRSIYNKLRRPGR
jgi:two-component system response regulator AtoC